ncbi:MAG: hypothetical protein MH204_05005, partial [Fimbriimonadaceae bacterium]|nr:hypothetical protein [Fimbriimonadaceae bacterium]
MTSKVLIWTAAGLACLAGCSPPPTPVSIDEERLLAAQAAEPPVVARLPALRFPDAGRDSLPALPAEDLVQADARALAEASAQRVRENQERVFERLRGRLIQVYTQSLGSALAADRRERESAYAAQVDQVYLEIRRLIDEAALELGPWRARIAWLAGFPDPDPLNRRAPRGGFLQKQDMEEAAELRRRIDERDLRLSREIQTLLDGLTARQKADEDALSDAEADVRRRAELQADQEARALAQRATRDLQVELIAAARQAPAVPGVSVEGAGIPSLPARQERLPQREVWPLRERVRGLVTIFIRERGYTLTRPAPGVVDKTDELLDWQSRQP